MPAIPTIDATTPTDTVAEKPHSSAVAAAESTPSTPSTPVLPPTKEALALRVAVGYLRDLDALDIAGIKESIRRGAVRRWHCLRCGWTWHGLAPSAQRKGRKMPGQCARCRSRSWQRAIPYDQPIAQRWLDDDRAAKGRWLAKRAKSIQAIAAVIAREADGCGIAGILALLRPEVVAYINAAANLAEQSADAAEAAAATLPIDPEMLGDEERIGERNRKAPSEVEDIKVEEVAEPVPAPARAKVDWDGARFVATATMNQIADVTLRKTEPSLRIMLGGPVLAPAPPSLDDLSAGDLPPLVTTPIEEGGQ